MGRAAEGGGALDVAAIDGLGLAGISDIALGFLARMVGGWLGAGMAGLPAREGGPTGLAQIALSRMAAGRNHKSRDAE